MYVFVMLSILQSQFTERFQETQNSDRNVVLLLFLFTLDYRERETQKTWLHPLMYYVIWTAQPFITFTVKEK